MQIKTNNETQFTINPMLKDEIKKQISMKKKEKILESTRINQSNP
jgi:hypothetical protein